MSSTKIITNPGLVEIQEKYIAAKESWRQWQTYYRDLENIILEGLKAQGVKLPVTGTLKLELLDIAFANDRKWFAQKLSDLASAHPHLIGSTLRVEYKPAVTKPKVDEIVNSGTPIGTELGECFEDKAKKPSFIVRPENKDYYEAWTTVLE